MQRYLPFARIFPSSARHLLRSGFAEFLAELLDDRLQLVAQLRLLGRRQLGDLHPVLLQLAERLVAVLADRLALERGRLPRGLLHRLLLVGGSASQVFFEISSTQTL